MNLHQLSYFLLNLQFMCWVNYFENKNRRWLNMLLGDLYLDTPILIPVEGVLFIPSSKLKTNFVQCKEWIRL